MRPFAPVCRAGVHARRTLNIFKNCIGAAGPAPAGAFRTGAAAPFRSATGPQGPALSAEMANRRAAAALRPEIKAPPYNTKQTSCRPGNVQRRGVSAGGIYAAPTHRPNAAATKKRCGETNVAGRIHAAPTRQGKRHTPHTRAAAAFYHTANLIFLRGFAALPPSFFIFIF